MPDLKWGKDALFGLASLHAKARVRPEEFTPYLSSIVNELAILNQSLGNRKGEMDLFDEALAVARQAPKGDPYAAPKLAAARNNLNALNAQSRFASVANWRRRKRHNAP